MKPIGSRSIRMCSDFCQRESGGRTGQNSPRLYALLAFLLRRWASQRREKLPCNPGGEPQKRPVGCNGLHNPPCMALPCCPPFAQGGLRRAAAGKTLFAWVNTTAMAIRRHLAPVGTPPGARKRSGKSGGRTAKTFLAFLHRACLARERRNGRPDTGPANSKKTSPMGFPMGLVFIAGLCRSKGSGSLSRQCRAAEPGDGRA